MTTYYWACPYCEHMWTTRQERLAPSAQCPKCDGRGKAHATIDFDKERTPEIIPTWINRYKASRHRSWNQDYLQDTVADFNQIEMKRLPSRLEAVPREWFMVEEQGIPASLPEDLIAEEEEAKKPEESFLTRMARIIAGEEP